MEKMGTGFLPSPYTAAKLVGVTMDIIFGNRFDHTNPYAWDSLVLQNYHGSPLYDPSMPRVTQLHLGKLANTLEAYVDDVRINGSSELDCTRAS